MTQEEKQLLLIDICTRLPYGVICNELGQAKKLLSVSPYKVYCLEFDNGEYIRGKYKIEDIKPYLRPMSSITDEEQNELDYLRFRHDEEGWLEFVLSRHLDWRGLIPKGLALEAPKDMYK